MMTSCPHMWGQGLQMFSNHPELIPEKVVPQSSRNNTCLELISLTSFSALPKSLSSSWNTHRFNKHFRADRLIPIRDSTTLLPTSIFLSQCGNKKPQWVAVVYVHSRLSAKPIVPLAKHRELLMFLSRYSAPTSYLIILPTSEWLVTVHLTIRSSPLRALAIPALL